MAKINKRQRFGLYSLGILILIGGYFYLLYLPKEKEYYSLLADRTDKEIQLRKVSIQVRNQERLLKEIDELEDKLTSVKRQLPKEKEIPILLKSMDSKGRKSNIDFLYFKPQPIITREFYGEVPIAINIKGGFHDIGLFLNKIAGMSRLINISNIKMYGISEQDEKITVKAEMTAKSYIYMENDTGAVIAK